MNRLVTLLFFLLLSLSLSAQEEVRVGSIIQDLQTDRPDEGRVRIYQNSEIEQLFHRHILQNAQNPGLNGYRIRIFFELGKKARRNSLETMNQFLEKYPGVPVYQDFNNPYWKVSVGDFRSREEAQKFYHQILSDYPKAFIITDWINFPTLE